MGRANQFAGLRLENRATFDVYTDDGSGARKIASA